MSIIYLEICTFLLDFPVHLNIGSESSPWIFQDGDKREEAESMLPKVKFWRDTGDTPGRKNHQEEAKL
jgi:hypothetical protein